MSELEWYLADLVDEASPPSKPSPEAYAFFDGERWQLGYQPDDKDTDPDDREVYNRAVSPGDVVEFMTCERLGDIEATLCRDGTFTLQGSIPPSHNVVVVNHDSDLLYPSFDEFIKDLITIPDEWCNPAELVFEDGTDSAEVTLSFADWSDPQQFLFEIVDGKPCFRQVPAQKN